MLLIFLVVSVISIVMSLEQIAIASTAASENVNITTNTNDLVTQITKVYTCIYSSQCVLN